LRYFSVIERSIERTRPGAIAQGHSLFKADSARGTNTQSEIEALRSGRGDALERIHNPSSSDVDVHLHQRRLIDGSEKLFQLRVLGFRSDKNGNVRVGIFPEREEILIGGAGFRGVALQ
jgi:hypothetical protein